MPRHPKHAWWTMEAPRKGYLRHHITNVIMFFKKIDKTIKIGNQILDGLAPHQKNIQQMFHHEK